GGEPDHRLARGGHGRSERKRGRRQSARPGAERAAVTDVAARRELAASEADDGPEPECAPEKRRGGGRRVRPDRVENVERAASRHRADEERESARPARPTREPEVHDRDAAKRIDAWPRLLAEREDVDVVASRETRDQGEERRDHAVDAALVDAA